MDKLTKAEGSLILDMIYNKRKANLERLKLLILDEAENSYMISQIENELIILDNIYNKDFFGLY